MQNARINYFLVLRKSKSSIVFFNWQNWRTISMLDLLISTKKISNEYSATEQPLVVESATKWPPDVEWDEKPFDEFNLQLVLMLILLMLEII